MFDFKKMSQRVTNNDQIRVYFMNSTKKPAGLTFIVSLTKRYTYARKKYINKKWEE